MRWGTSGAAFDSTLFTDLANYNDGLGEGLPYMIDSGGLFSNDFLRRRRCLFG